MDSEIIRELLENARDGDNAALGKLIDQFRPLLIKQAREQLDSDLYVRSDPSVRRVLYVRGCRYGER